MDENVSPELLGRIQVALATASRMGCAIEDLIGRIEDDLADQDGIVCAMRACIKVLEDAVHPALDETDELVKSAEVSHG